MEIVFLEKQECQIHLELEQYESDPKRGSHTFDAHTFLVHWDTYRISAVCGTNEKIPIREENNTYSTKPRTTAPDSLWETARKK